MTSTIRLPAPGSIQRTLCRTPSPSLWFGAPLCKKLPGKLRISLSTCRPCLKNPSSSITLITLGSSTFSQQYTSSFFRLGLDVGFFRAQKESSQRSWTLFPGCRKARVCQGFVGQIHRCRRGNPDNKPLSCRMSCVVRKRTFLVVVLNDKLVHMTAQLWLPK